MAPAVRRTRNILMWCHSHTESFSRGTLTSESACELVSWPAIAFGGVIGPLLLMIGLARTPASTTALLLNLEGVLTALFAWFIVHENFDRRSALGMIAIVAGGVVARDAGCGRELQVYSSARACVPPPASRLRTRRINPISALTVAVRHRRSGGSDEHGRPEERVPR